MNRDRAYAVELDSYAGRPDREEAFARHNETEQTRLVFIVVCAAVPPRLA